MYALVRLEAEGLVEDPKQQQPTRMTDWHGNHNSSPFFELVKQAHKHDMHKQCQILLQQNIWCIADHYILVRLATDPYYVVILNCCDSWV